MNLSIQHKLCNQRESLEVVIWDFIGVEFCAALHLSEQLGHLRAHMYESLLIKDLTGGGVVSIINWGSRVKLLGS